MRQGEMTEAEAAVHPQRHILTRALGVSSDVETDMWELHLHSGDRVLLCSDGLSNEVDLHEMSQVLGAVADPVEAAQRLVDVANANGGADNITVVIVDVQIGEDNRRLAGRGDADRPGHRPADGDGPGGRRPRSGAPSRAGSDEPAGTRRGRRSEGGSRRGRRRRTDHDGAPHGPAAGVGRPHRRHARPRRAARLRRTRRPSTLAGDGPRSDEFFLGNPTAAVPVARSTARVPPQPPPQDRRPTGRTRRRAGASAGAGWAFPDGSPSGSWVSSSWWRRSPSGPTTPSAGTPTTTGS